MCLKVIHGLDVTPQAGVSVDLFLPFLANCPALQEAFLVQQSKDLSGHIGCVLLSNHKGEILRRSWPYRIGTPCPLGRQVCSLHSTFTLSLARTNNIQIMLNVKRTQQKVLQFHENKLIQTVPMINHSLFVWYVSRQCYFFDDFSAFRSKYLPKF